ncbi:NADPH-dependent assimilatory sulfite reductase flavoprotein subunit [Candidatus Ishikawella capsulata]|nr:NADPH-dependent assimilatory sulfite reductase flavoprotein subunit [Candidatus Ishikawaella capsulata]
MINEFPQDFSIPLKLDRFEKLQKIIADLSKNEIAWLSGYFWGLVNENNCIKNVDSTFVITIISASQTGNARLVAEQLKDDLLVEKLDVNLLNANDYNFKKIDQEKILIIITSTYGEGEPPEEAVVLYNFLMSKKIKLNKTAFAIFGLGDKSYEFFNKIGKDLDKRLEQLGAERLLNRVDADIDYTEQAVCWRQQITSIISQYVQKRNLDSPILMNSRSSHQIPEKCYTKENPFSANIALNQKITGRKSNKDIRHIEIDIQDSMIKYQPGDTVGIWYQNDYELVKELTNLMCLPTETVKLQNQTLSLEEALQNYLELTVNTPQIVEKYAVLSNNKTLLNIVKDKIKLRNYCKKIPLIEMIREAPAKIQAMDLIKLLRPLKPRFYSISSSQDEVENEIHITVSIICYKINNRIRSGGASRYLASCSPNNDKIRIFIKTNDSFRLPKNLDTPIVMICSGTGIAPFRAFMQQRDHEGAKGKNWLFFGNQKFTEDFLYQVEWQRYVKKGLLTKIDLAWSQDQREKIYVQHKIREKGKILWDWIQENAYIYVCGNANYMAKDVEKALLDVISKYGNMDLEEANNFLNQLRSERRYQRDVY